MIRLSDSEETMTLAFFVLTQYQSVTDGRTDGHSFSGYTSACIACYANALVKKNKIINSEGNGQLAKQLPNSFSCSSSVMTMTNELTLMWHIVLRRRVHITIIQETHSS